MLTCMYERIFFQESSLKPDLTLKISLLCDYRHGRQNCLLCTRWLGQDHGI